MDFRSRFGKEATLPDWTLTNAAPLLHLRPEYEQRLASIVVTRHAEVDCVARRLIGFKF
jgi:hypothetical protein